MPDMRTHTHKRRTLQRNAIRRRLLEDIESERLHAEAFYADDFDGWDGEQHERDLTCPHCSGTGGDPWNDGITPCEFCDGEGYEWWN